MAIGQALLVKPSKQKPTLQQQQGQGIQQANKTAVLQEQPLKFEQSLELVQTLLGASIGCLSFLRGLLPEECFVEKRYGGKSAAAISYRSFTSDIEDETFKKTQPGSGTRVKRLRRGYSGEADQLLDWLEIGIFDALKMGYLKAVQLAIYVDKNHPDIIVESYTFSFSYRDQGDGTPTISLRVIDIRGRGVTVEDANKNLQLMMRRLIVITQASFSPEFDIKSPTYLETFLQNLPPLPDQRWLTIRLHYLDHTPSDYDPPSFVRVSEKSPALKFHETEAKEVERLDVGGLDAGFHAVSLKISSMNDTDSQERPKRRRGARFVHADMDIEAPQFTANSSQSSARSNTDFTNESLPGPTVNEHAKPQEFPNPVEGHSMLRGPTTNEIHPISNRRITEITKRDIQEKKFLRGMLRQTTRENDVVATQPLSLAVHHTTTNDSQLASLSELLPLTPNLDPQIFSTSPGAAPTSAGLPSVQEPTPPQQQAPASPVRRALLAIRANYPVPQRQSPRNKNAATFLIAPADNAIESVDQNMAKLQLSKAKAIELKTKEKANTNRKRKPINKKAGEEDGPEDHINCECGDEKFDEDMICCDNCDEWQHTDCYGFESAKDIRIPDYHVCYSCLLGKNEGQLLEEMRNMALFRRALRAIWKQGSFPTSNKGFANKLGCDLPTALQLTRRLENEGFIMNDIAKSKAHKKRVFIVIRTEEIKEIMETQYFDPLKKISHHFENPTGPNIIRESFLQDTLAPAGPINTIEESQLEEIGNVTEEAIIISKLKVTAQIADVHTDSTADEEDDLDAPKNMWDDVSRRRLTGLTIDRPRHPNRTNITNPGHGDPSTKNIPPIEIAESPEPMEIDAVEESQAQGSLFTQATNADFVRPRMNIAGALHDIFVGEELGDRRF